jgi:hypothetical protein
LLERDALQWDASAFQLSKKGFEVLRYDMGELRENRFAAQSVAHDFIATAFHLGDFVLGVPENVRFFSEQEIQCTDDSLLPAWVPKFRDHIPDGLTRVKAGQGDSVFGLEVELNLKPMLKYDKAAYYFDSSLSKVDVVFWLCGAVWIAKEISQRLQGLKLRNREIHHFIAMEDFKEKGWQAVARSGAYRGKTVQEIYNARGVQWPGNTSAIAGQSSCHEIFFPKKKSPFGLRG